MPGPDTVVEESPVLVYLLLILGTALAWAQYRGLRFVWGHTIGWVFAKIAGVGIPIPHVTTLHPFQFLGDVNTAVNNYLAAQALEAEQAIGRYFHQMAHLQLWIVDETFGLAKDLYAWADTFQNHYLRKFVKPFVLAAFPAALIAGLVAKYVAKELPHIATRVKVIDHYVTHTTVKVVHAAAATATTATAPITRVIPKIRLKDLLAVVPGLVALPWLLKEVRTYNRRWELTKKRLRKLEALAGATAFAGLMANTLGLGNNWRCIRKGNIGKTARRLCGLDLRAFEGLLSLLADTLFLTNICDVIKVMVSGLGFIQPELTAFITATETMACYGDNEQPPSLGSVVLGLPNTSPLTLDGV